MSVPAFSRVAQTFVSQKVCGLSGRKTAEFEKRELCAYPELRRLTPVSTHPAVGKENQAETAHATSIQHRVLTTR